MISTRLSRKILRGLLGGGALCIAFSLPSAAQVQTQTSEKKGETTKTVTISVNGDTKYEPSEQFFVNLSNPSNATIGDSQGVGTITNDDAQPSITIADTCEACMTAAPAALARSSAARITAG